MTKPKIVALAVVLVGAAIVAFLQQREIKRLTAEGAALRDEIAQAASLRDENERLATQLKVSADAAPTDQRELMRLRAQSAKLRQLEQENAKLKVERQAQKRVGSSEQPQANPGTDVKVTTITPTLTTTDLGMLEFSDGVAARFDLGGGTNCIVTPTAQPDGRVTLQIAMLITSADGTSSELGKARITGLFGQRCSISVADRIIALGVNPKNE
jgi:hypothetical protein